MRAEWDSEAKALYVYFDHPDAGKPDSVAQTWPVTDAPYGKAYRDVARDGNSIGFEFLEVEEVKDITRKGED